MIHLTCSISDPDLRYEWLKNEEIKPVAKVKTEQEDQNYGAIKKFNILQSFYVYFLWFITYGNHQF